MALVFALSRRRRFCCDACGKLFYAHTIGSWIWLAFWILCWIVLALGLLKFVFASALR